MVYQLNQTTQLGKMTEEMLEKLIERNKQTEGTLQTITTTTQCNKQINTKKIEEAKVAVKKRQLARLHEEEYNNLKERDHRLALNILVEERKTLEAQVAEYKMTIQMYETGKNQLTDIEIISIYKLYEHLQIQKQQLDKRIAKYDLKEAKRIHRDEDKENLIKTLAKKMELSY